MISPQEKELLEQLGKTPYGGALQAYLNEAFDELNNVQTCLDWEDTKARQKALGILEKLFRFMAKTQPTVTRTSSQFE